MQTLCWLMTKLVSLNRTLEDKLKVNFISSNSIFKFSFGNCVSAHANDV